MFASTRIFLAGRVFEAPKGARLLDILDDCPPPLLATACRAAHCGLCKVRVTSGSDAFMSAAEAEQETLEYLEAIANERLGCQLVISGAQECATLELVGAGRGGSRR